MLKWRAAGFSNGLRHVSRFFEILPSKYSHQNKAVSQENSNARAMSAATMDRMPIPSMTLLSRNAHSGRGNAARFCQICCTLHRPKPVIRPKVNNQPRRKPDSPNNGPPTIAHSGESRKTSENRMTGSRKLFLFQNLNDYPAKTRFVCVASNAANVANMGTVRFARLTHNRTKPAS
jgi:hypothetical protein